MLSQPNLHNAVIPAAKLVRRELLILPEKRTLCSLLIMHSIANPRAKVLLAVPDVPTLLKFVTISMQLPASFCSKSLLSNTPET